MRGVGIRLVTGVAIDILASIHGANAILGHFKQRTAEPARGAVLEKRTRDNELRLQRVGELEARLLIKRPAYLEQRVRVLSHVIILADLQHVPQLAVLSNQVGQVAPPFLSLVEVQHAEVDDGQFLWLVARGEVCDRHRDDQENQQHVRYAGERQQHR